MSNGRRDRINQNITSQLSWVLRKGLTDKIHEGIAAFDNVGKKRGVGGVLMFVHAEVVAPLGTAVM